jgi:hypothetical protein
VLAHEDQHRDRELIDLGGVLVDLRRLGCVRVLQVRVVTDE